MSRDQARSLSDDAGKKLAWSLNSFELNKSIYFQNLKVTLKLDLKTNRKSWGD